MAAETPPKGIVVDPRVLAAGGAVALVGIGVLALFMWMVPNAAARESHAACAGLRPASAEELRKEHPKLCTNGTCQYPIAAPDFTAYDHAGKPVKLSSFRGKVVLVNFWGSWCGVCKTEKPQLNAMAGDLSSDDFAVVALASDRSWSDVLLAIVETLAPEMKLPENGGKEVPIAQALDTYKRALPDGVPFQVYLDPPAGDDNIGQIAWSWGTHAVPDSVLIDRQGMIRGYFINKRDWESPVAETCLRSVIDGD
jgi:thiol-disulfide isomerase/thioredoxin